MYISNFTLWQPSDDNLQSSPKLEFCDPLFKRRFSQITKMTIQVLHDLVEARPDLKDKKIVFASFRGEIKRELTINQGLIEDDMILPAGFSLSVFNTPVSSATIALKLKAGYSVIFPSEGKFSDALKSAAASVESGDEDEIIFVYADEKIPDEYSEVIKNTRHEKSDNPMAFAFAISKDKKNGAVSIENCPDSIKDFLALITDR